MASNLQELRKEAGYKSAKDFATAIDIPVSTYSRYEAQPDSIPLAAAKKIADYLNTSIDLVVGREEITVADMRGEVQKIYDALSDSSKTLVDEFLEFVQKKDEDKKAQARLAEVESYKQLASYYERIFFEELEANKTFGDFFFSNSEQTREEFQDFVEARARAKREEDLKGYESHLRSQPFADGLIETFDEDGKWVVERPADPIPKDVIESAIQDDIRKMREGWEERDSKVVEKIMDAYDSMHGAGFEYGVINF